MTSGKVPLCEKCRVPIHPGVTLLGEMVEIGLTTKAADEVSKADTLLLAGTNMRAEEVQQFLCYFQGERVILIHSGTCYGDHEADYFVEASVSEMLPKVVEDIKRMRNQ